MPDDRIQKPHRDEACAVEGGEQTQQKVEIIRQYEAAYVNIIANYQARGGFDNRTVYLVDACAGAGPHRSDVHPGRASCSAPP